MSAPVLAFRNPNPAAARPTIPATRAQLKLDRLIKCRPFAVEVIENLIDDLQAEYDANPAGWARRRPPAVRPRRTPSRPEDINPADVAMQWARLREACAGEAAVVARLIDDLLAKYGDENGGA